MSHGYTWVQGPPPPKKNCHQIIFQGNPEIPSHWSRRVFQDDFRRNLVTWSWRRLFCVTWRDEGVKDSKGSSLRLWLGSWTSGKPVRSVLVCNVLYGNRKAWRYGVYKKKKWTNNRLEFLLIGGRIINSWELTGQVEILWNTLGGKRNLPSSAYTHTRLARVIGVTDRVERVCSAHPEISASFTLWTPGIGSQWRRHNSNSQSQYDRINTILSRHSDLVFWPKNWFGFFF